MMPDREKVINELEERIKVAEECMGNTMFTPDAIRTIIALLKEQEAVEPKKIKRYNPPMFTLYEYECKKCKSPMMNKQPFCMGCGRPVSWK